MIKFDENSEDNNIFNILYIIIKNIII